MSDSDSDSRPAYRQVRVNSEVHEILSVFRDDLQAATKTKLSLARAIEIAVMAAWEIHDPALHEARKKRDLAEVAFVAERDRRYRDLGGI